MESKVKNQESAAKLHVPFQNQEMQVILPKSIIILSSLDEKNMIVEHMIILAPLAGRTKVGP